MCIAALRQKRVQIDVMRAMMQDEGGVCLRDYDGPGFLLDRAMALTQEMIALLILFARIIWTVLTLYDC